MSGHEDVKKGAAEADESKPAIQKDAKNLGCEPQSIMEVIEALPEEYRPMVESAIIMNEYSGPLPDANMMKEYEKLAPGSTERCMKVMEDKMTATNKAMIISVEIEARKAETEAAEVEYRGASRKRGQWLAFVLFLIFGLLSFLLVLAGYPWPGVSMFGLLAGIGGVLIYKDIRTEQTMRQERLTDGS